MLIALFGITDDSLNLAVNLLVLVLVVIWIALIWWTYSDARRRIDDSVLVFTATAASLFPFIGTVVYSILRPPEFLADARERELETWAAELRLRRLKATSCPRCEYPVELSWLRCPQCRQRLKDPCRSCGRPVDPKWELCPVCETAVEGGGERAEPRRPAPIEIEDRRPARRSATAEDRDERERRPVAEGGAERRASGAEKRPSGRPASARQSDGSRSKGERRSESTSRPKRRSSSSSASSGRKSSSQRKSKPAEPEADAGAGEGGEKPRPTSRRRPTPSS